MEIKSGEFVNKLAPFGGKFFLPSARNRNIYRRNFKTFHKLKLKKIMSDFWSIYENGIRERFDLQNALASSKLHGELINSEMLFGMAMLRPRPGTTKVEKPQKVIANENNNPKGHFCQKCSEEFETHQTKIAHMIEKHPKWCPYCVGTHCNTYYLQKHVAGKHKTFLKEFLWHLQENYIMKERPRNENARKKSCRKNYKRNCKKIVRKL